MKKVMVVGATGFIGRNLLEYLNTKGVESISLNRSVLTNSDSNQLSLSEFNNIEIAEFQELEISRIVYALGDPNMNGKANNEIQILNTFLEKLENLNFSGKFVLISSNAANPDSGYTCAGYREKLTNDYIRRKQALESLLLSSPLNKVVLRAPAIIGTDMNVSSHLMRISSNQLLAKVMSIPIFRGTIEILTIDELCREIYEILEARKSETIIEPCAPAYHWFKIARRIAKGTHLQLEKIEVLGAYSRKISLLLPISLRFLFFPHWVTKCHGAKQELMTKHQNIDMEISRITSISKDIGEGRIMVTGCASGLGAEVTRELLERGFDVVGVDKVDIERNFGSLGFQDNGKFTFLKLDLTVENDIDNALEAIKSNDVNGIYCVAGIGPRQQVKELRIETVGDVFNLNLMVPIKFTMQMLQKRRKDTFLVYVGSSSGITGIPKFASYSASKSALHSFFFSYVCESKSEGMRILGVIPSGMKTNFQAANQVPSSSLDRFLLSKPEKIARYMVDWAIDRSKSKVKYFGFSSYFFLLIRVLPFRFKVRITRFLSDRAR